MGYPVILVDSATGSDSQASGAGPATALFGTTDASTDAAGTTVTLTAGTDLTNVATDGTHVIYLADTTAGHRRFSKITSKAGSGGATPTVGVADAFTINLTTKSWAIGGKRASLGSASSILLVEQDGPTAGDANAGWVGEWQSGHTETISGRLNTRVLGDITNGPFILRGKLNAAVVPIITFSADDVGIVVRGGYNEFRDFDLRNSNGSKTASIAITEASCTDRSMIVERVRIADATNNWWKGISLSTGNNPGNNVNVYNCEIAHCVSHGIIGGNTGNHQWWNLRGNKIYSNGGCGIFMDAENYDGVCEDNEIYSNTSHGISYDNARNDGTTAFAFKNNTIDSNGGDGIKVLEHTLSISGLTVVNNQLTNNGTYGLEFSDGTATDMLLSACSPFIRNNNTYNNTSGAYKSATAGYTNSNCPWASGDPGVNPTYVGSGDYTPTNTAVQVAYPTTIP